MEKILKTNDKNIVKVNDEYFFSKVEKLDVLIKKIKLDQNELDSLKDDIKNTGLHEWINLYEKIGENPGSIILEGLDNNNLAKVMFVPNDKYLKINDKKAIELVSNYNKDIIESKETLSIDSKMLEKYKDLISDFIMNSPEIEEKDKDKILKYKNEFSIKKGTINKLSMYSDYIKVLQDINPVLSLKNIEIFKENS